MTSLPFYFMMNLSVAVASVGDAIFPVCSLLEINTRYLLQRHCWQHKMHNSLYARRYLMGKTPQTWVFKTGMWQPLWFDSSLNRCCATVCQPLMWSSKTRLFLWKCDRFSLKRIIVLPSIWGVKLKCALQHFSKNELFCQYAANR